MLNEIKLKIIDMLKEIDGICKKYNITYYAEGGTIIGALRHNGLIPWDDDADIVMTRENFNKFVEAVKKENNSDRFINFPKDDNKYPLVTIKYVDNKTTTIFKSLFTDDIKNGFFIDIFILDPVPRGKEKWFKKNFLSYDELLCNNYVINNESSSFRYKIDLLKSKIIGKQKVLKKYREKLFNFTEEESDYYLIRWGITYQLVKKEYYGKPRLIEYNGIKMPVPEHAERIITNHFGDDWFILPEEEEQMTHDVIRDLKRSYKLYSDDYYKYINVDKLKKNLIKVKYNKMSNKRIKNKANNILLNIKFSNDSLVIKNIIKDKDIIKLYKENKYNELHEIVDAIYQYYSNKKYSIFKSKLGITPEEIKYVIKAFIDKGEYYKGFKLLKIYNDNKNYNDILEELTNIREAKLLYFEGKYKESKEIVNKLLNDNKNNISAYKIKLDLLCKNKDNKEYVKQYDEIIEKLNISKDIELNKYLGDILLLKGNKKETNEKYNIVLNESKNGILLKEIKKI